MSVLPAQTIRIRKPISPFRERTKFHGLSYGVSAAGYDIRIAEYHVLYPGKFELGSSLERFEMPDDLLGIVHDKSTWARKGLAVQNTVIEPGWCGYLTIELTNHGQEMISIGAGMPIAQIIFHQLSSPSEQPYTGKYQNQKAGPQQALFEKE
jgi:dCTP deaminase